MPRGKLGVDIEFSRSNGEGKLKKLGLTDD
jgi:hypothetical protein